MDFLVKHLLRFRFSRNVCCIRNWVWIGHLESNHTSIPQALAPELRLCCLVTRTYCRVFPQHRERRCSRPSLSDYLGSFFTFELSIHRGRDLPILGFPEVDEVL
jgi:hypothetical protein